MIAIKIIAVIISIIGVLGTLLPALPGTPLVVLAALIYGFATGFTIIGWEVIISLTIMSIIAQLSEYLISGLGAKYFGASKYGIIGAILGGILGLVFLGPLGMVVGPFLGAISIEFLTGKEFKRAVKVGVGTIIGFISASIFSFIISLIMTAWVWVRIFGG